ncbi:MAG: 30S ribosomal protein S21 [Candidatus Cybelea sp.]
MFDRGRSEPLSGVKVLAYPGESVDSIVRRLKKVVEKSLILVDARGHKCFVPKSERRRLKSLAARKRRRI